MRLKLTIVRTVVHCHVGWVQVPELTSLLASLTSADYGQERLGKNMFGWLCRKFCKGNKLLHNCAPYQAAATADEGHEPDYHTDDAGFHFSVKIRGRGRIAWEKLRHDFKLDRSSTLTEEAKVFKSVHRICKLDKNTDGLTIL